MNLNLFTYWYTLEILDHSIGYSYSVNRLPNGHFYIKKLGESLRIDNTNQIMKLEHDKLTLKQLLKVTRHNSHIYKNMIDELIMKNEVTEDQLEEKVKESESHKLKLESTIENCKKTDADLVFSQQETKACNEDLVATKKINLECQLKTNRTQPESHTKNTDADSVILQQELNKCNDDLEVEMNENLQYESKMKTCVQDLKKERQTSRYLRAQKSKLMKSLLESRSSAEKRVYQCENKLKYEIKQKDIVQGKYKSVCQNQTSWSEWSDCSKILCGIKTRTDRCSKSDDQIKPCNQDISCPKSGNYKSNEENLKFCI